MTIGTHSSAVCCTSRPDATPTAARVRTFAVDTEPLISGLEPVLDDLQPTLASLRRLSPDPENLGCGDSFAAALAYGLGAGMELPAAIELGARCGAACLCGRGPYAGQLELA